MTDDLSDRQLLDRFIAAREEAAFRVLVQRHLGHVHAVAGRVTASEALAADVAQATFVRLAQRAALLPPQLPLTTWLHRTARSLAIDLVRVESRRKKREHQAGGENPMHDSSNEPAWQQLAPVIDELVESLPAVDRDVLLLRYYGNHSLASIGGQTGLSEDAARKRVSRALEKLRALLGKRGIATTTAALSILLPAHAATPAPVALMLAVSHAAQGIVPLAPHGLSLHLAMTTLQKSAIVAAAVVFLVSLGYSVRRSGEPAHAVPAAPSPFGGSLASDPAARSRSTGRRLPATAEDRLERLREILAIPLQADRLRELLAYTDLLGPGQFAETAEQLKQLAGDNYYASDAGLVISAWAGIDPLAAATWALKNGQDALPFRILPVWGDADPQAALAWVVQHKESDLSTDLWSYHNPFASVLSGLAVRDPAAAVKAFEIIPDARDRQSALERLADETRGNQPEAESRLLAAVDDPAVRSQIIARSMDEFRASHPERKLELLLSDEGARKLVDGTQFFRNWAWSDPAAALAHLPDLPDGSKFQRDAVVEMSSYSAKNSLPQALDLLRQYPAVATDLAVVRVASACQVQDAAYAADQVLQLHDAALRDDGLAMVLTRWKQKDPAAAAAWMDAKALEPHVLEQVKNAPANPPAP